MAATRADRLASILRLPPLAEETRAAYAGGLALPYRFNYRPRVGLVLLHRLACRKRLQLFAQDHNGVMTIPFAMITAPRAQAEVCKCSPVGAG
jgi:hypothetical protein